MNADPGNLANLRDIIEPLPVSWWPPAPGWWVLLGLGLLGLLALAVRGWRSWQANAYRRVALAEIEQATDVFTIAQILKRTALVAYPRTNIAELTGAAWIRWLGETGGQAVPPKVAEGLSAGIYSSPNPSDLDEAKGFAAEWVRGHSPEQAMPTEEHRLEASVAC